MRYPGGLRLAWALVLAAGCYAPVPATGVPCAANGDCPVPLMCDLSRAVPTCEKVLSDAMPVDVGAHGAIDNVRVDCVH